MKAKKLILFLLVLILIFTLATCGNNTSVPEDEDNNVNEQTENNENNQNTEDPVEEDEEVSLTLYFANQEYIITGNEELDMVIPVKKDIQIKEKSKEKVILEELKNEPEDENLITMMQKIEVLSVETKDNTAYVDLSSESLSGGSLEESLILNQIVFSLTELSEVEEVQILVDGNIVETLMGHIAIEQPLKREDINR